MTAEIKTVIEQIRAKSLQIHQDLVAERERVSVMASEISRINQDLELKSAACALMSSEIEQLQVQLTEKREQVQVQPSGTSDSEIDVLVKEIDFCIQQLKIANE